ncbi:hypothetical protein R9C00_01420 [Flammeovirgaceae bacterium SG7u.111]|nr:hypothetical protein [Flammeovirgaceae bacterium SG7u.132]WPO36107.1 hypothetical protein R9C00_01420 [Flammeovirgaceae bacterium SG7u.111]
MNVNKQIFRIPFLTITGLCLLALATPFFAQNLVPNPGFEDINEETSGQAAISNVKHWFNANMRQNTPLFGTPDHMFAAKRYDGSIRNGEYFDPYKGNSTVGVITFLQRKRDYREYFSVRLLKPMQMGKKYQVKFHVTSGNKMTFGNIGTNGLGALFTVVPAEQFAYEPMPEKPQYMMGEVFHSTEWEEISFVVLADKPYEYLTIGNFLSDYNLTKRYYHYDIDPQSYLYIDEVSVISTDSLEIEEEVLAVNEQVSVDPEIPEIAPLEGREINIQSKFKVEAAKVTIKVWDLKEVDGDVISLKFNDQWVLKDYMLRKRKKKIKLKFRLGEDNKIIFFAHTLGDEPPNTAAIMIKSGKRKRTLNIRSDLNYCGAIQLTTK